MSEHAQPAAGAASEAAGEVLELVRARHASGSRPGARDDGARLALVVEGGSSRAAYGGGMVAAIEEMGLLHTLDAVYGSSAGALNGAWLLCGRANLTLYAWWSPWVMRAIISPRRALLRRPVVDGDLLVDHIYEQVTHMDFDAILASPVEFHPIGTDVETGEPVDLAPFVHDRATLKDALRATTRMPVLSGPPVMLGGRGFVDAGISEMTPVHTALAQGATHVLALRTRRADEVPRAAGRLEHRLVNGYLTRHAPGTVAAWAAHHERKVAEEETMADHPRLLQIRPPVGAPKVSRTGRSPALLRTAVELGRQAAVTALRPALQRP